MELMEVYCQLLMYEFFFVIFFEEVMMRIMDLLIFMKLDDDVSIFCEEKSNVINCLLSESFLDKVKCFVKLVWFYCYLMVESYVIENLDEIIVEISC